MKQKTAKEMSAILTAYANRSGSKKEFCSEHQIAMHTLDYWRRKLSPAPTNTSSTNNFVAVELDSPPIGMGYELCFPNGNRLKMSPSISMEVLHRLVKLSC